MEKLTPAEIRQKMYELGFMYYPAEKLFKKFYIETKEGTAKLESPIVKTWKEARGILE